MISRTKLVNKSLSILYDLNIQSIQNKSFIIFLHGVEENIIDNDIQFLHIKFDELRKLIQKLGRYFDFVSLDDVLNSKNLPKGKISITFDDGYKNNFKFVHPFFKSEKIPYSVYLTTSYIGTNKRLPTFVARVAIKNTKLTEYFSNFFQRSINLKSNKDKSEFLNMVIRCMKNLPISKVEDLKIEVSNLLSDSEKNDLYQVYESDSFLSIEEIREMSEYCTFGSHTENHFIFHNKQDIEFAHKELVNSKKRITEILGRCDHFALPNGNINNLFRNEELFKKNYSYKSVATTNPNFLDHTDNFLLPRFTINSIDSLTQLKSDIMRTILNG